MQTAQKTLVLNVKRLMKAQGIRSQAELCRRAGIPVTSFNAVYHGRKQPGINILDNIGSVFGLSPWQLLSPNVEQMFGSTNNEQITSP